MKCKKCGSDNVQIKSVVKGKTKKRGCFGWLIHSVFIVIFGPIFFLISMLTNKKKFYVKTKHKYVCMNCGKEWN